MLTKGDVILPSRPNECILKEIDLPPSQVYINGIFMSNQENIIDELLEKCDFDDENLTTCCSNCYRKDDQCICLDNQEHMVNEVQYIYDPYHESGSEQVFLENY